MIRQYSSGGVVFKRVEKRESGKEGIVWLVVKSSKSEKFPNDIWHLPKGWLDDEDGGKKPGPLTLGKKKASQEDIQNAALREVREEGGVDAKIIGKVATESYFFTHVGEKIAKFVTFYLMEWVRDLPKGPGFETEKVEWLEYEEGRKRLTHSGEKKILDKAKELLESGIRSGLI